MSGATKRSHYFWIHGRVVRRTASRPSGFGPWPPLGDERRLICIIERDPAGISRIVRGPAHSPEREIVAVTMEHDRYAPLGGRDIGQDIPHSVLNAVRKWVEVAVATVTRKFRQLSNEERTTGALTSHMEGTFTHGGWTVEIATQGFSSVGTTSKEPRMGGDLGIILDIANGAERVIKAMLIQAKRSPVMPTDPLELPELRDQLRRCRQITRECYGWVYTPQGVLVVREGEDALITPGVQVATALSCRRGDRSRRAVASAVDRDYVVQFLASGPQSHD